MLTQGFLNREVWYLWIWTVPLHVSACLNCTEWCEAVLEMWTLPLHIFRIAWMFNHLYIFRSWEGDFGVTNALGEQQNYVVLRCKGGEIVLRWRDALLFQIRALLSWWCWRILATVLMPNKMIWKPNSPGSIFTPSDFHATLITVHWPKSRMSGKSKVISWSDSQDFEERSQSCQIEPVLQIATDIHA